MSIPGKRCDGCRFWVESESDGNPESAVIGTCCRGSPVLIDDGGWAMWPKTGGGWSCWQFEGKS